MINHQSDTTPPSLGVLISIFCAGTPSTAGTKKILERLSVRADQVAELRYRGRGWPGRTTVTLRSSGVPGLRSSSQEPSDVGRDEPRKRPTSDERSLSYEDSWGTILCKHTQFRCRLCPDSTGELADISCGDPWYRKTELMKDDRLWMIENGRADSSGDPQSSIIDQQSEGDPGRSLVLVRTETGRRILHAALAAGYLQLEPVEPDTLPRSQPSLLQRRRQLWGRLLALRTFGVPVPRYRGFSLWRNWCSLPFRGKLRSLLGTVYRLHKRHWRVPQSPEATGGSPNRPAAGPCVTDSSCETSL